MGTDDLPVLVIDGRAFDDFAGFQRAFSAHLTDYNWNGSLDAFNDVLRGGFGTPEGGWVFRWQYSSLSRAGLGYAATVARLESLLPACQPSNRGSVRSRIEQGRRQEGPTLFDEIVHIIRDHGPGGDEEEDGVLLELQ